MGLEYNDIKIENKSRISPSSFTMFYNNPYEWYKNNVLKENTFKGNTDTVVGSIIHHRLEQLWTNQDKIIDEQYELDYIDQHRDVVEVDEWKVADEVGRLWETLETEVLLLPIPTSVENSVVFEIPNSDYFVGGTYDYMRDNVLGDIKTTSVTPKKIKVGHRIQLLLYWLCLRMNGNTNIDKIEVTYIVKLKKEPKVVVLQEDITDDDFEWIKTEVKKMVKRLDLVKNDKDLAEIVFFNNPDSRY